MDSNPGDHQPSGATDLQRPLNGASGPRQRRYQRPHDVHPVELTALTGRASRPEAGFPLSNAVRGLRGVAQLEGVGGDVDVEFQAEHPR